MTRYVYCADESGLSVSHMLTRLNVALRIHVRTGLRYLHNPRGLGNLEHGLGDGAERLFALGLGEACAWDYPRFRREHGLREVCLPAPGAGYRNVLEAIARHPGRVVFVPPEGAEDPDFSTTRAWVRRKYRRARARHPLPSRLHPERVNVAVHVRAGDLYRKSRWREVRALPLAFHERLCVAVAEALGGEPELLVFTETPLGPYAAACDLSAIGDWPLAHKRVFVDNDFAEDFHNMLEADVFIGSKSLLTYVIAALREAPSIVPTTPWISYAAVDRVLVVDPGLRAGGGCEPRLERARLRAFLRDAAGAPARAQRRSRTR